MLAYFVNFQLPAGHDECLLLSNQGSAGTGSIVHAVGEVEHGIPQAARGVDGVQQGVVKGGAHGFNGLNRVGHRVHDGAAQVNHQIGTDLHRGPESAHHLRQNLAALG